MFKHTKLKSPEGMFPIHAEGVGVGRFHVAYMRVGSNHQVGFSTDGGKNFRWFGGRKQKSEKDPEDTTC